MANERKNVMQFLVASQYVPVVLDGEVKVYGRNAELRNSDQGLTTIRRFIRPSINREFRIFASISVIAASSK
jgi:hypothetical protein